MVKLKQQNAQDDFSAMEKESPSCANNLGFIENNLTSLNGGLKMTDTINNVNGLEMVASIINSKKQMTRLDAALVYVENGFKVFPVTKSKRPYKGIGVYDATTDKQVISNWFNEYKDAQVALPTGQFDIVVIDIDGEVGKDQLNQFENKFGKLPDTLTQKSGSGGMHLFFRLPDGIDHVHKKLINDKSASYTNIDIKFKGGYVLVAPSQNENGEYRWEIIAPISDAPDFLINHVVKIEHINTNDVKISNKSLNNKLQDA